MRFFSFSKGSKYYANEDRLYVLDMGIYGVAAILADGMGGLSLGSLAAEVITRSIAEFLRNNYRGQKEQEMLLEALERSDNELRKVSIEKRSKMGAAVAIVIIRERKLFFTWQGNVRVYVLHEGKTTLVTSDHLVNIGYEKTALTRCIKGAGLRDDIPFLSHELEMDDDVFICTDGFYKMGEKYLGQIPVEEIAKMFDSPEDDASLIEVSMDHS